MDANHRYAFALMEISQSKDVVFGGGIGIIKESFTFQRWLEVAPWVSVGQTLAGWTTAVR